MQVDLKSTGNFLPALVQQSQEWFDCFAVSTAVSNDINGRVTHSVYLTHQLVVSTLQHLL